MKTMPRTTLKAMRLAVEFMLTHITAWEDKHADHTDYRMRHLSTGLWQASQSMREILDGQFEPMRRQAPWNLPQSAVLGDRYTDEVLGDARIPLHVVEN